MIHDSSFRSSNAPSIGVFDSGLGGFSVLSDINALLPGVAVTYLADTAHCPYGPKPVECVRERSLAIGRWLLAQGAVTVVVACNTASSAALEALRAALPVPVVGMEPGLKPAAAATNSGKVGVLATSGTLAGQRFATLKQRYAENVEVLVQPCSGWVEAVEAGALAAPATQALVSAQVAPLLAAQVDTLVLGCTHFPFLLPQIRASAGPAVTIINTGPAVARQVARVLAETPVAAGPPRFCTTGNAADVTLAATRLRGIDTPFEHVRC